MIDLENDIRIILEAGAAAPSGENSQPWRFRVDGSEIFLYLDPKRDQSLYNWGQRASYLADGAALENMLVAAQSLGYRVDIKLFPDPSDETLVAKLSLESVSGFTRHPLYEYIGRRVTNRKPYFDQRLSPLEVTELKTAFAPDDKSFFTIVEKRDDITSLAKAGATNEEIMLENKAIHQFFFDHVNWTKEEDDLKRSGFYIETLELPSPARAMFRIFRHWPIMRVFLTLKMNRKVSAENAKGYTASAAVGIVHMSGDAPKAFVQVGRAIERLWLTATKLGLFIQPITGVLYFMLRIMKEEGASFTTSQSGRIRRAYDDIARIGNARGRTIPFMFRIGRGDPPTARSSRFTIMELVTK